MRIRKIEVKNFRNLQSVCVYPSKTTIIVGENDVGKSNFIHAIRILLDPQADRLRLNLSEKDIYDFAVKNGECWFSILIEIGDLQKHPEVETCFRERISQDGSETFAAIEGKFEKNDDGDYEFHVNVLSPDARSNNPIQMKSRMYRALPLYYLDALRDADNDLRASGRGVLAQLLSAADFSDVEGDIQNHLHEANDALSKGADAKDLSDGVSSQLTQLMPGGQSSVVLTVTEEDPLLIKRGFRLGVKKTPTSGVSDITRHGMGLQNLMQIALFRHRIAKGKIGVPILAIEEPEAHVHPHAQRRLFQDLDSVNTPVIITTHSSAIVKNADPRDLILFRSISETTHSFQLDREKISEEDLSNLSQLMRGGRSELFFARAIIIVEGESELLSFPAFADALGCNLDRDGISLVDAGSNNFSYILRSCSSSQFSIPTVVTYDSDALVHSNNLLKEACSAGLIEKNVLELWKNALPDKKIEVGKQILGPLGWIAVDKCFEEQAALNGYLNVILQAIENKDADNHSDKKALEAFLNQSNLQINADNIAFFVTQKRKTLKIPISHAIAKSVSTIKSVPECYANAIRKAVLQSQDGILVDNYFEQRAYFAGFRDVIFTEMKKNGIFESYTEFSQANQITHPALGISKFFTETEFGQALRPNLKIALADAIETCGCKEYAELVRISDFPNSTS